MAEVKKGDKAVKKNVELSEEDLKIKELIEFLVEKIISSVEAPIDKLRYIKQLFNEVLKGRESKTAIPKQLKFLKPHFESLELNFASLSTSEVSQNLADLLSITAGSLCENYTKQTLKYLMLGTKTLYPETVGDEYILTLAGDLTKEYFDRIESDNQDLTDILELAEKLAKFMFEHNHEINGVDLFLEINALNLLFKFVDAFNYPRIFEYLTANLDLAADSEDWFSISQILFELALRNKDYYNALRIGIKTTDISKIQIAISSCEDEVLRRQLGFLLGKSKIFEIKNHKGEKLEIQDDLFQKASCNLLLGEYFQKLLKDLDVVEAKRPLDVYKEMVDGEDSKIDSAILNLADSIVSGFVNVGSLKERLISEPLKEKESPWISRVKDIGIMTTIASLGFVYMWNFEEASSVLSEYFDLKDGYAKAGACIALGLSTSGVWDENEPAKVILSEYLTSEEKSMKQGAVIGLGLAYASSLRNEFKETFESLITNEGLGMDVCGLASLSLSLIFAGSCDEDVSNSVLTSLMAFSEPSLNHPFAKFFSLALGINFLGQQQKSDAVREALMSIEHAIGKFSIAVVEALSFSGSGNILKIQEYMQRISKEETKTDEIQLQGVAMIGLALISRSENVGNKMVIRLIHQILSYSPQLTKFVPAMIILIGTSTSNPQYIDLLYKLSHDEDKEVALRSLLALGIVGAGTNNSRIGSLLKSLSGYYETENEFQYCIRVSLGFLHMGKGLVGLNPSFSDGFLTSNNGLSALLILVFAMLDCEEFLIKNHHFMFSFMGLAISPKSLFYLNDRLEESKVTVRVGTALDTVAQVGKPRKITGFQTHESPVLINDGERLVN